MLKVLEFYSARQLFSSDLVKNHGCQCIGAQNFTGARNNLRGREKLLNFIYICKKFHNCYHTNVIKKSRKYTLAIFQCPISFCLIKVCLQNENIVACHSKVTFYVLIWRFLSIFFFIHMLSYLVLFPNKVDFIIFLKAK